MEKPRPSSLAWMGLVGGVVAWDALCPEGETLSERLDPILDHEKKRFAAYAIVGAVGLHLCNSVPERYDGIHHLAKLARRRRDQPQADN